MLQLLRGLRTAGGPRELRSGKGRFEFGPGLVRGNSLHLEAQTLCPVSPGFELHRVRAGGGMELLPVSQEPSSQLLGCGAGRFQLTGLVQVSLQPSGGAAEPRALPGFSGSANRVDGGPETAVDKRIFPGDQFHQQYVGVLAQQLQGLINQAGRPMSPPRAANRLAGHDRGDARQLRIGLEKKALPP